MDVFSMSFQAHLLNAYHAAYPIQCCMLVTYPRFLLDPELCLYSIYPIGPIDMFMPVTQQTQFLIMSNTNMMLPNMCCMKCLPIATPGNNLHFDFHFATMICILPLCCWKLAGLSPRTHLPLTGMSLQTAKYHHFCKYHHFWRGGNSMFFFPMISGWWF